MIFETSGCWICGFLAFEFFWILGSFVFSVLLLDTNAASVNEPKSDQQKNRFRTGLYNVLKGFACRRGGDHIYIYICIFVCVPLFLYLDLQLYSHLCSLWHVSLCCSLCLCVRLFPQLQVFSCLAFEVSLCMFVCIYVYLHLYLDLSLVLH